MMLAYQNCLRYRNLNNPKQPLKTEKLQALSIARLNPKISPQSKNNHITYICIFV